MQEYVAKTITLPQGWTPRSYQVEVFAALDGGKTKRVVTVWHRRSGKDASAINYIAKAAHQRVGNYWHLFPTARQGRKALWESVDKSGRRVIDQAIPVELRESTRNDEMMIRLKCGSTIQITGADQVDSLVGSNPVGVVFSEYALTSPVTWRFVEPILIENGGWAWFNSTPRGKNHLYDLVEKNRTNPSWLVSIKGWRDTGVITQADIDEAVRGGMPPEVAEQEFNCSFNAPNVGLVYARQIAQARQSGRIGNYPWRAAYPVETWWDIGHRDATSIWFVQRVNGSLYAIDYVEERGKGLPHFANEITKRPYAYSRHVGPHDLENKVWALDGTTKQLAENHGISFVVAPKLPIKDGIDATRAMFSTMHFHEPKTDLGLKALGGYEYEWDEERRVFGDKPLHNWASHGSDALRYGAVTPASFGVVPVWAREIVRSIPTTQPNWRGHNGGPSLNDEYDPLGAFRAYR